ncbi:hypothetical protein [Dehalococcoides mccartyi]|uniref:hypothetical protein n=1 Tax=Dehalococcoides mccartyi TaxID=61435 RepID=UPI000870F48B|nr:hypothetical protein [Dehalococcoides mccartyi]AOV98894.1 hypothetical protein DCWBC2_0221 [Dehalococcoides mccartyi]
MLENNNAGHRERLRKSFLSGDASAQTEEAIWDEFIKPLFEENMEMLADLPASSLLPSETHITRKALSAGTFPDSFDSRKGEDKLLKEGLAREFGYAGEVDVIAPDGTGTGEVVHYRAGNLDVFIFELCDKELHKIQSKSLPNGRQVPSRPLAFVYQQHIKNIIDTEVMAIIRKLTPGTKVFITADHGFCHVGRNPLWFNENDLNDKLDCSYLYCLLKVPAGVADLPLKVRENMIFFTPKQLRMPTEETREDFKGQIYHKHFETIVFPKVGYSFSRQGSNFNPDAYTHGGISIQELMIPMVALRIKDQAEGILNFKSISGPVEIMEGQEVEMKLRLIRSKLNKSKVEDLRVDLEVSSDKLEQHRLTKQVLFVPVGEKEFVYRFRPDTIDAPEDERKTGIVEQSYTVIVSFRDGQQLFRKSQRYILKIRLNSEKVVRRVPPHLGSILGLTPKNMR